MAAFSVEFDFATRTPIVSGDVVCTDLTGGGIGRTGFGYPSEPVGWLVGGGPDIVAAYAAGNYISTTLTANNPDEVFTTSSLSIRAARAGTSGNRLLGLAVNGVIVVTEELTVVRPTLQLIPVAVHASLWSMTIDIICACDATFRELEFDDISIAGETVVAGSGSSAPILQSPHLVGDL